MSRQIDETARSSKRNEILDCAQRLIYETGYEEMSIQDIISQIGISKGAFYHYFDSKPALLEELLNRTSQQAVDITFPILDDPDLSALEKLEKFYTHTNNWKITQKPYLLAILKAWYMDENAIVRQKLLAYFTDRFTEILGRVFRQGMQEGVFHPAFPDLAGGVVYSLMVQMSDSIGGLLLSLTNDPNQPEEVAAIKMEKMILAYTDAIERVLGAMPGSIHLVEINMLRKWFPGTIENQQILEDEVSIEKEYRL